MVGIDYGRATVEVRERFSLTRSAAEEVMHRINKYSGAEGCVLISTCNRVELWLSGTPSKKAEELLCEACGLDIENYRGYLVTRTDREAVEHLFALAAGLRSQVFGEDQIVTQVGNALTQSRDCGCAGPVLETLFRLAITAAKRVKTEVRLTAADRSAAVSTVEFLNKKFGGLDGVSCLVIGNGEMGRLIAQSLVQAGGVVQMTLRQYHHGEVIIPEGVKAVPYDERYHCLKDAQIVVSATASPHYTLRAEQMNGLGRPVVFCDLAVPRDIEPEIAALEGAELYDTDTLCGGTDYRADPLAIQEAQTILEEEMTRFYDWYTFRTLVPLVQEISGRAAEDVTGRMARTIRHTQLAQFEQEQLNRQIADAAAKAVGHLIFGLKESLAPELWRSCLEGLQKSAMREDTR